MRFVLDRQSCTGEQIQPFQHSVDKPLESIRIPGGIPDLEGQPFDAASAHVFADHFMVLDAGCYRVTTTPLASGDVPTSQCTSASANAQVRDGQTTEVLLINQCKGVDRGGIDIVASSNHPPALTALVFERSKFLLQCEEQVVCATAKDPDGDPVEFQWTRVSGPVLHANPTVVRTTQATDGSVTQCVRAIAETPARYELKVAVYDQLHADGHLVRFEDYFTQAGDPQVSHDELTFPFYAASDGRTGGCIATSCKELLQRKPGTPSGNYQIDPDGSAGPGAPFQVQCDMQTDGGGWTLIARANAGGKSGNLAVSWTELLSRNYYWSDALQMSPEVLPGYQQLDFFALLRAVADMPFQQLRFSDGRNTSSQGMSRQRTMRAIQSEDGVEPLYRNGENTGVLLLLGHAAHTSGFPCFYPSTSGTQCATWFAGDSGSQTTAFYVGDLDLCKHGPAAGNLAYALWGSADCYETNQAGGFVGFTVRRPLDAPLAWVDPGYKGAEWSLYVR
jgi:hypothetical protein